MKARIFEIYERAPFYLHGVLNLIRSLPDDPDRDKWKRTIELYGNKYLKQVCSLNPFGITPAGIQKGEFVWLRPYGRNPGLLQMAIQCVNLAEVLKDEAFLDLSTNFVQWIFGLHIGIPGTEAQPWCYLEAVPASFINGIGTWFALQVQPAGGGSGRTRRSRRLENGDQLAGRQALLLGTAPTPWLSHPGYGSDQRGHWTGDH